MFLRHLRRTRLLLQVVDASAEDPGTDYLAVREELRMYNPDYVTRPHVVALNKVDLEDAGEGGRWRAGVGGWRADGGWRVEGGGWRVEGGGWRGGGGWGGGGGGRGAGRVEGGRWRWWLCAGPHHGTLLASCGCNE
jgi:hypothetical protein